MQVEKIKQEMTAEMATLRAELQPVPAISESQLTSLQDRLLRLEAAQLLTGAELETLEDIVGDFLELKALMQGSHGSIVTAESAHTSEAVGKLLKLIVTTRSCVRRCELTSNLALQNGPRFTV
eukprot:COSAG05_NODE_1571_length_4520_cov_30.268491_1_plen_123_part_00